MLLKKKEEVEEFREIPQIPSQINSNYSNLEYDLNTGKRLTRLSHVEELFQFLTGAESVLIVNNNASAIFLVASVLSKQKEILISKGESVEIGGGFRISDIINESGAKLIEVGTTNKTYIEDSRTLWFLASPET